MFSVFDSEVKLYLFKKKKISFEYSIPVSLRDTNAYMILVLLPNAIHNNISCDKHLFTAYRITGCLGAQAIQ